LGTSLVGTQADLNQTLVFADRQIGHCIYGSDVAVIRLLLDRHILDRARLVDSYHIVIRGRQSLDGGRL